MRVPGSLFRPDHRALSDEDKEAIGAVKAKAQALAEAIAAMPGPVDERCRALAMTRLEEAVMWAVKAATA